MIDRRNWTAALLASAALPGWTAQPAPATPVRGGVLRVYSEAAETGFDPAKVGDIYSARVLSHIFEALYRYDPLAMPVKVRPLTAVALPEVSSDFRVWTIRLQPGIHFADDAAFKGKPRELVAEDYVYSIKRFFDPANLSPAHSTISEEGFVGLDALRERSLRSKTPFDYDTPVDGVRALDRYTLRITLAAPRPRFLYTLCDSASLGAVAREVIEAYACLLYTSDAADE